MNNQVPDSPHRVAIVIVTWNSAEDIGDCLAPLIDLPSNWEIFVIDNRSSDNTAGIIRRDFPRAHLIENSENAGFAAACNRGVRESDSEFVLFLNPDTRCDAASLEKALVIATDQPRTGVLGVRLHNDDGSLQRSCYFFPTPLKNLVDGLGLYRFFSRERLSKMFADEFFDHESERSVDWLMGAFLFCRRECIDAAGGIPEDYFMFGEDMDFCRRAHVAGYDVRFTPRVSVIHKQNRSAGQRPSRWRIERTILSRHLFCLTQFGAIRGRVVQFTDLIASYLNVRRSKSSDFAEEWRTRSEMIRGAMFLPAEEIRRRLNER